MEAEATATVPPMISRHQSTTGRRNAFCTTRIAISNTIALNLDLLKRRSSKHRSSKHRNSNRQLPDVFVGDFLVSSASNNCADAGAGTASLNTMSPAFTSLPYKLLLASLSGRRVEPEREIPANSPRARE